MDRQLSIIVFAVSTIFCSCNYNSNHGRSTNEILVIPGLGLVIDKDTIKLAKTRESEIFHLFKMTDTILKIEHGSACGYDADGNDVSWDTYFKDIHHDGLIFNYKGSTRKDSLTLEEIRISDTTHWTVKVNDSIILGKNMPDIFKYFPRRDSSDAYDNYSADLWSYGISFGFDDNGSNKKLSYISVSRR